MRLLDGGEMRFVVDEGKKDAGRGHQLDGADHGLMSVRASQSKISRLIRWVA
jgi:hypothetical protein